MRHTDWLHHHLTVTGPVEVLRGFRSAASGAGVVPWALDGAGLEEEVFLRLVSATPRTVSVAGARILAGQLRAVAERRHDLAVARVGHSRACPFDLHALVPVPDPVLALGPNHPDALVWLWEHWGTTETLRHVIEQSGPVDPNTTSLRLGFWSADWTPWRALSRIRADWPALCFDVQPTYDASP